DDKGCVTTASVTISEPVVIHGTDIQTACDSYTWIDGQTYTESNNSATWTLTNANGCDSIVTLDLTINYSTTGTDVQTACDFYTWIDGITYTESNNSAKHTLVNAAGCDSIITLDLTINNSTSSEEEVTACDSYEWNGNVYNQSGKYTAKFINESGCDSTANLILTITNSSNEMIRRTACDQYMMNGITYTESGTYVQNLENREGCNLTLTIELTILNSSSSETEVTSCDSYTWNGATYTESGIYTTRGFTNNAGCDSTATLILTINNSTSGTEEVTACESFNWNGVNYTESGTYSAEFINSAGCDSTATLILTINKSTTSSEKVVACESYNWNGVNYTESGSYTSKFTNSAGCDSIANLILTINKSTTVTEEVVACESYNWNGEVYTESGSYSAIFTNSTGCDSIVNLKLTINNSTESFESVTECKSYIWNGIEYTQSGSYSAKFTNATGCDSIANINLTIIDSTSATINETACGKATFNNVTYTESGVYEQRLMNAAGCDSILTINLTITSCVEEMILVDDKETVLLNTPVLVYVQNNDRNIPQGSVLTAPATTPIGGKITINDDGSVTYTPPTDYIGEDSFIYTITTPDGGTGTANVTIVVTAPADMAIDAVDDEFEIFNNERAEGSIIINDINTAGNIMVNTIPAEMPKNGTVVINSDGTVVYTPNSNFSGIDSFKYQICNSIVPTMCDEAVVTIYVSDFDTIQPPFLTTCDSLFIPNGFSPNDDNINDYFTITLLCKSSDGSISESEFYTEYPDAKVEIYNRWGNLVFEKERFGNIQQWGNTSAWWDGRSTNGWTVGNDMLPPGTYFYILNFNDGTKEPKAGSVFLNR
ncbi:MAG TPA: Ig-like domain-containing protein, partial [Draconibacterium sp.]|nr:Ig-like domain-containing protein [Draconibacterium sp.]